jgi:L-ascorbate metabolism protein UlaG (beta-lactamase superfamily)
MSIKCAFALFVLLSSVTSVAQLRPGSSEHSQVTLTYLGTAGWQVTNGNIVLLIDPYFSRLRGKPSAPGMPGDKEDANDHRHIYAYDEPVPPDTSVIDTHVTRADYILVTHAHIDHVMDVPYIAKKTGAQVIGNLNATNLMLANSIPDSQLITVKGGEDYEFGRFSVRVIPSLHSALNHKHYFDPDPIPPDAKLPLPRSQYGEGGTLGYLIRIGGHEILVFGSNNFIERELEGLRPDVVIIGPYGEEIHEYAERLMHVLGNPSLVLPTHWDNFFRTFDVPQDTSVADKFLSDVKRVSPSTKTMVPRYFEPINLPPRDAR